MSASDVGDLDEGERRPSTAPESMSVTVSGIVDTEKALEFAHLLAAHVRAIGTVIDVSRLNGLHAADDYPAALEAVDRGFARAGCCGAPRMSTWSAWR